MIKNRLILLVILVIGLMSVTIAQPNPDAVAGEWLSPKRDSRLLIYRQGAAYYGKIVWGTGTSSKDEKNPDPALRNRDLIGLVILKGFTFDGQDTWTNGTIYDPREGKTYACKMTIKNPNSLSIRGYIGVSLFGRTDIWTRVN